VLTLQPYAVQYCNSAQYTHLATAVVLYYMRGYLEADVFMTAATTATAAVCTAAAASAVLQVSALYSSTKCCCSYFMLNLYIQQHVCALYTVYIICSIQSTVTQDWCLRSIHEVAHLSASSSGSSSTSNTDVAGCGSSSAHNSSTLEW
jgi:hypothetical protein